MGAERPEEVGGEIRGVGVTPDPRHGDAARMVCDTPRSCLPNMNWTKDDVIGDTDHSLRALPDPQNSEVVNLLLAAPWEPVPGKPGRFVRRVECRGREFTARVAECCRCGRVWPAAFMLKNTVWDSFATPDHVYCLPCVEALLGRPLTPADFMPDVPANAEFIHLCGRPGGRPDPSWGVLDL
jgi:hypothetical protein